MKRRSIILSVLPTIALPSFVNAAPTPYKASDAILLTFENFPSNAWQLATSAILGSVYILKSDVKATELAFDPSTVHEKLGYVLNMSGMQLGQRTLLNVNYERIDEVNAGDRNQCVAFGKSMTGAGTTSGWIKGTALSSLYPNGRAPSQLEAMARLQPGTLIANFDGSATYPNRFTSHVAVVRGVNADSTGKILSIDVYAQNGMSTAKIGSNTVNVGDNSTGNGGTIMKYSLPWSSTSTMGSLSAKNYHVVNKP